MSLQVVVPARRFINRTVLVLALTTCAGLLAASGARAVEPITSLVTINSPGYSDSAIVLQNGGGVLFHTKASLAPEDTDVQDDVYLNNDGAITFLTPGLAESVDLKLVGATDDGSTFYVETTALLDINFAAKDNDGSHTDVYAIKNAVPTLVSTADTESNGPQEAWFAGVTPDGSTVFYVTPEQKVSGPGGDLDGGAEDVYAYRPNGTAPKISWVSTSDPDPQSSLDASFCGTSDDGSVVAFRTDAAMTAGDTDGTAADVYVRSAGITTLASTNPNLGDSEVKDASCRGVSADGSTVVLETTMQMDAADDANQLDVYTRSSSTTRWISTGPNSVSSPSQSNYAGMSGDGETVFFNSGSPLVTEDTDTTDMDGFVVDPSGDVTLLTDGSQTPDEQGSEIYVTSRDGRVIVFRSNDTYVSADTDDEGDLYATYDRGPAKLASTGPADTHGPVGASIVYARDLNRKWAISATGDRIAFYTYGGLVADDTDAESDVYQFAIPKPLVPIQTPSPATPDVVAPAITNAKLSNKTFAVDKKIKALSTAKTKKGTKITFTLSEAASVKLAFQSKTGGRKSGSKCVKQTSKNKSAKKCTIVKTVKTAKVTGVAGSNSVTFGGRIGSTTLKIGDYQLSITATDAAGNTSTAKSVKFKIITPK